MRKRMTLILLALTVWGCLGDGSVGVEEDLESLPIPSEEFSGFKVFVQAGPHLGGEQTVAIRLEGDENELGSYQVRLHFDAGKLGVLEVLEPADGYRVLNRMGVGRGELRFAGFTVERFADRELLRIRFQTPEPIRDNQVHVELEVVGTLEGVAVPRSHLSVQAGLFTLK